MEKDVDAVIAALKAVLREVERRDDDFWETAVCNRWIDRLPGAWAGRWRHSKVRENDCMVARGMVKRFLLHRLLDDYDAEPARRRDWSSKIAVHV
jgi:hypothetical protein